MTQCGEEVLYKTAVRFKGWVGTPVGLTVWLGRVHEAHHAVEGANSTQRRHRRVCRLTVCVSVCIVVMKWGLHYYYAGTESKTHTNLDFAPF